jgi:cyclopropane-fatty-acyl-phospholipid synthase
MAVDRLLSLDAALGVVVVASALSVALDALFGTNDDGRAYSRHSAGERSIMKLGDVFERVTDADVPIGFRAYDRSMAGPRDARGVVVVRSPAAVRNFVSAPSELGLARAYVTGAIEVDGELHDVLKALDAHRGKGLGWRDALVLLSALLRTGMRPVQVPAEESRAPRRGTLARHTRGRDAASIGHHYDISNRFYELLLGPSMTYSCALFGTAGTSLEDAQRAKIDLVCRKLDLRPGSRLLDIGAGWGALVRHAATHYGASAIGVTLSAEQATWATRAIEQEGLTGRVEVRLQDARDVTEDGFDAISSVGAMEHIGTAGLGGHFAAMAAKLRPQGRMLNHTITRPSNRENNRAGPFIDRYVFPDGELQGPGTVMGAMHDNGLEVRHSESLREHYAMTVAAWRTNLETHWGHAVREVGERRARVWRLYLALSQVGFETNRIQIHQFLAVAAAPNGRSGMPLRPGWTPGGKQRSVSREVLAHR